MDSPGLLVMDHLRRVISFVVGKKDMFYYSIIADELEKALINLIVNSFDIDWGFSFGHWYLYN